MGDYSKFSSLFQYYCFNFSFMMLMISELFIFLYTYQKYKSYNQDRGTKVLLYLNFIICIFISFYCVSKNAPVLLRLLLPEGFSNLGIFLIFLGIMIRLVAVFTLKQAFTLNVQITNNQHLVTIGIYHFIRHPAYSGSILSLIGIALALKNIYGILIVMLSCLFFYLRRIKVEEKLLLEHFNKEYQVYQKNTYKLFPFIL